MLAVTACVATTSASQPASPPASPPRVAPPEAEPEPELDARAPGDMRGRFVGHEIGAAFRHGASKISLPPGMELSSVVQFADDSVFITAKQGADLVVLLVRETVVVDDVTMAGLGDNPSTADCDTDMGVGVLPADACGGDEAGSVRTVRSWTHEDRQRLVEGPELECWCDLVDP